MKHWTVKTLASKATALPALALALLPTASMGTLAPARATAAPLLAQAEAAPAAVSLAATSPNPDPLYLAPDAVFPFTLELAAPVTLDGPETITALPAGAIIRGQFEPAPGGLVYRATGAEVDSQIVEFAATSALLPDIKDPRETSTGAILGDTAIGAAGGAAVSGILRGRIGLGEVLGGAAAGAIIGNVSAQRVVVVDAGQTLDLQLD